MYSLSLKSINILHKYIIIRTDIYMIVNTLCLITISYYCTQVYEQFLSNPVNILLDYPKNIVLKQKKLTLIQLMMVESNNAKCATTPEGVTNLNAFFFIPPLLNSKRFIFFYILKLFAAEFSDSCVRLRLLVIVSSAPFRYLLVLRLGRSDRQTVLIVADV